MDIYVGSLPFKLKEKTLQDLFERFGKVNSVKIVIDHITRQNKGFGFVNMPNDEEAELAIEALNGTEIMERSLVVSKSGDNKKTEKRKKFGKGGVNLKGDFDKTKKAFPGKSGHQHSARGGKR